jgi:redox-sensitive bicupin YhaK (pirin superfamily)
MSAPRYQTLLARDIPVVDGVRVIAGEFRGAQGPAQTFTPVTLLEARVRAGESLRIELPEGHSAGVYVVEGKLSDAGEGELMVFERKGTGVQLDALSDALVFVMSGAPIHEPVAGYGPFVMNTPKEIQQAYADFHAGRLGKIPTTNHVQGELQ